MIIFSRLRSLLRWTLLRRQVEDELATELDHFMEHSAADRIKDGVPTEEARRQARIALGGVQQTKETVRSGRPLAVLSSLGQDLGYGMRILRKDWAYTLLAVLTLTLGIGGATAMYSLVDGILLSPLPYSEPEELVSVYGANFREGRRQGFNAPLFLHEYSELARQEEIFDAVAFYGEGRLTLDESEYPVLVDAYTVSPNFLATLGVAPIRGRPAPAPEPGATVFPAVVSHGFWNRHFGGDPELVGRTIRFQEFLVHVTGIMGPQFRFPYTFLQEGDVWISVDPELRSHPRPDAFSGGVGDPRTARVRVIGRLGTGITFDDAGDRLQAISESIAHPREVRDSTINGGFDTREIYPVDPREETVRSARGPLWLFFGAVLCVLFVAILNVVNLTLGRSIGREREVALRVAVGSSRGRIVRQLLTESLLLAGISCGVSLTVLYAAMDGFVAGFSGILPRLADVQLDSRVLAFGIAMAVLSAVALGLAPIRTLFRVHPHRHLAEASSQFTEGVRARSGRSALVAAQLALALVLLVSAGLILESFMTLTSKPTGVDTAGVLAIGVTTNRLSAMGSDDERARFWRNLIEAAESVPGVSRAAVANLMPLSGVNAFTSATGADGESRATIYGQVSAGYFQTFRIPILEGRIPREGTTEVVVNETMARWLWPGQNPVGGTFQDAGNQGPFTVAGVARDVRTTGLQSDPQPEMYRIGPPSYGQFFVRTEGDLAAITPLLIDAIHRFDPAMPVPSIAPFDDIRAGTLAEPRFRSFLFGTFAATALFLTMIGVYGVASHAVARRDAEFAIRAALGARPQQLVGLVLRQGARPLAAGAALGLMASAAVTRLLDSFLFEVRPTDASTFALAVGVLVLLGLLANLIPALRLARFDPAPRLRNE